jgi:hypothetical protein
MAPRRLWWAVQKYDEREDWRQGQRGTACERPHRGVEGGLRGGGFLVGDGESRGSKWYCTPIVRQLPSLLRCFVGAQGYQYRLAPAGMPLTEALFQKMPLPFVGRQQFRWAGKNGTVLSFDGDYVSTGTSPPNSTWCVPLRALTHLAAALLTHLLTCR